MASVSRWRGSRRQFLEITTGLLLAPAWSRQARAEERPAVTHPRATGGDWVEPNWEQRLTVTVGPQKGDLVGSDDKVIQAAVDYVTGLGGGTVHLLPGTYRLRNAVYLQSRVRILGSGLESILLKEPSQTSKLAADSDWYD